MGRISTHVLDTTRGAPAPGVAVELYAADGAGWRLVGAARTNADGRTDEPLLSGERVTSGVYELRFAAAEYFRAPGAPDGGPAFLETVVIRFGVANAAGHYHVPLLISPYGYTTYRGS